MHTNKHTRAPDIGIVNLNSPNLFPTRTLLLLLSLIHLSFKDKRERAKKFFLYNTTNKKLTEKDKNCCFNYYYYYYFYYYYPGCDTLNEEGIKKGLSARKISCSSSSY